MLPVSLLWTALGCFEIIMHVARYTFASVVALANNVSLENVAKMLGHSDTRMTQHYAKVMDSSIMREMKDVGKNFANGLQ